MAKSGAYISDISLLEQFNDKIVCSGEAMANIDQNVSNHLNGVRNTLEQQLNSIQQRLDDAEARLSEAESACSTCHASQMYIPEVGVVPDCTYEEMAVESARMEVEKWRMRYEQGKQIVEECRREIEEYNGLGGGHGLIQNMCNQQTPKASQLLHGCIDRLQDILGTNVGSGGEGGESLSSDSSQQDMCEVKISSNDGRFDAFRKSIKGGKGDL